MIVRIARIYTEPSDPMEFRILVDRIWPRGISKERAHLGDWCKSIAPSTALRTWFGHMPERFPEFHTRYIAELDTNPDTPAFITLVKSHRDVVLLYGAKDIEYNQAVVLRDYLASH